MRLYVRLTPKAAVDRLDGWEIDDKGRTYLKVRVRAAPIDGRANEALIAFLAKQLGLAKSQLELVNGETARFKTIDISGVDLSDLVTKFDAEI